MECPLRSFPRLMEALCMGLFEFESIRIRRILRGIGDPRCGNDPGSDYSITQLAHVTEGPQKQ